MSSDRSERRQTFEALFERDPDPWDFETSRYEREKRAAVVAVLGGRHFESVLEIGCATGVQTAQIAPHCKSLLALDVAQNALAAARKRLESFSHVSVRRAEVPQEWPGGIYDLILFSEVLYFLSAEEIGAVSRMAMQSLAPGGSCVLVNWTGPNELPISGDLAVEIFQSASTWRSRLHRVHAQYRIDVLTDLGPCSPAAPMEQN